MADYDNTNRGIMSKNDRREKDTQPEITGSANIEGTEYWINCWVKERKDGNGKFFSLSFKRKEQMKGPSKAAYSDRPLSEALDDTIPF